MSITDHSPASSPDGRAVLHHALGAVAGLDGWSVAEAANTLAAVADRTGHAPLCVAREVLHLLDPAHHQPGPTVLREAVHRRWSWPPHQRHHRSCGASDRVWAVVLAAATSTRPAPTSAPPRWPGRVPNFDRYRR